MKKLSLLFITTLTLATVACKKKTDEIPSPASGATELSGNLSTMTLDASKKYLLKGTVFVNDGQTLTIPAGTVIMGDKATKGCLLINTGGKIMAEGTASNPIVFTSAQAVGARDEGDWCGVILLGKANVNQTSPTIEGITPGVTYGTTNSTANDADNSGIMKYVRIEFAGIALTPNNETNSLTLGGVGSGTQIDYVQSSFGGDDSFEWFGGTVKASHLISYAGWDDDFDMDFGFSGALQYAVAVREPFQADQSGSNGFEVDNDGSGTGALPLTSAKVSNVTILGPIYDSTKAISGNFQHGAHLRRNSQISLYNSVITGFPIGINIEASSAAHYAPAASPTGFISGNIMINLVKYDKSKTTSNYKDAGTTAVWTDGSASNATPVAVNKTSDFATALSTAGLSSALLMGANGTIGADPNFAVNSGTLSSGFVTVPAALETVSYRGAFGATDWTDGWANFDPKNANY